ncbi:unnamed protein product [Heterobilharzia americana]|nr:unnamed protein product [Heterobilharzia americana]
MVLKVFQDIKELIASKPGVCDVNLTVNEPVTEDRIRKWEMSASFKLPEDMKDFYLTTNGVELIWYNVCNEQTSTVGQIRINKLQDFTSVKLNCVSSVGEETKYDDLDLFVGSLLGSGFKSWPSAYELEKCPNGTTVVFIFDNCQNGVFVLSNDLSIHKICSTFEQYIRLAIVHLGLRDWQLWYTTDIPSLNSQQLCSLYIPERLLLNAPEYREQILFYLEDQCPISFDPKKLIDLEITRRDRSKFSSKIAAPGVQSKRGRSSDSLNLRTTETLSTGRKLKNK